MLRLYALVYEPEYLLSYHSRFTGAGAGEDELEAFAGDCGSLGGVEGHSVSMVGAGEEKGVGGYQRG